MIEESLLEHLLVKSCAVEAHRHRAVDISLKLAVGGCGIDSVGIEPLIKHKALENRLSVEEELIIAIGYRTQPEIAHNHVVAVGQYKVIKPAPSKLPEMFFRKRKRERQCPAVGISRYRADLFATEICLCGKPSPTAEESGHDKRLRFG